MITPAVSRYFKGLPDDQCQALLALQNSILTLVPDATVVIAYQMPTVKYGGRMLLSYGAATKHCALYPGAQAVASQSEALVGYSTSKGTIRFQPDKPIPFTVIKAIVTQRLADIKKRAMGRAR